MAKKLDWTKSYGKSTGDGTPKVNFKAVTKQHKQRTTILTAKGTPDIRELRRQIEQSMKKLRNGF